MNTTTPSNPQTSRDFAREPVVNANAKRGLRAVKKVALLAGVLALASASVTAQTRQPKDVVQAFFELAFVQGKPTEAAMQFISPIRYIQHNPMVGDGRDAFLQFVPASVHASGRRATIKRVIAENDLVVIHASTAVPGKPDEPTRAVMDIFRVENGLIVEHWDAVQEVPKKAANTNTMF